MTRKKIHVTAEDIANGVPSMKRACPVALAIQRETNLHDVVYVHKAVWTWRMKQFDLARSAWQFITRFDNNLPVEPFAFFTEVPDA